MRKSLMDETQSLDRLIQLLDKTERLKKILPQNIVDKNLTSNIPPKVELESNKINYKNSKILKENEIVMIWDSTDFISVFSFKEWKITKEQVKGIPYNTFLENNRFIQNNDKVYITGGLYNDSASNLFICLERPNNTISKLNELPIKVVRQSLVILRDKYIVLVGGTKNSNCFIYNIHSNSWNQIQTLNEPHEDGTLFVLNNEYIFCFGGKLTKSLDNLLEYVQINNEYEYFNISNLYWKTISLSKLECLNENLLKNLYNLSGAGIIFLDDNILICGGYNSISSEEYNFIFSLSIDLKEQSCFESNLEKYDKSSLIMPNWFPEKIFMENNGKAFNFDVDGNIIVYDLTKGGFERIEFEFYSD
jgi:hypothetical protein